MELFGLTHVGRAAAKKEKKKGLEQRNFLETIFSLIKNKDFSHGD